MVSLHQNEQKKTVQQKPNIQEKATQFSFLYEKPIKKKKKKKKKDKSGHKVVHTKYGSFMQIRPAVGRIKSTH